MKRLEVRFTRGPGDEFPVGVLAGETGRVYFEYDVGFLERGLELSPMRMPAVSGLHEHRNANFGPLPGLFADSLPDGWGLLLMDRHFRSSGLAIEEVSPLDRLAWLGANTMGALTYHPPADAGGDERGAFDLGELCRAAHAVLEGKSAEVLPQLLRAGGSPGGARPKVLVGVRGDALRSGEADLPDGWDHWMVKFPGRRDDADAGPVEHAYSLMARAAGVEMPETRLFDDGRGGRHFGAARFDRRGNRRFHVHTFAGLIETDFRVPACDYGDLLRAASILTRNQSEVLKAFRLMAFNVLAHNRDDHAKNFAFLLDDESGEWRLAPAYDLTLAPGPGGEHTMTVAGEGRSPGPEHMRRLATVVGIKRRTADEIIGEVRAAVGRWPEFAARSGVGAEAAGRVAERLGHP